MTVILEKNIQMVKPKGGRGKRAPYSTLTKRIPEPIADQVDQMIEAFHSEGTTGDGGELPTYQEAVMAAQSVLSHKKGARESLKRFIKALYGREAEL